MSEDAVRKTPTTKVGSTKRHDRRAATVSTYQSHGVRFLVLGTSALESPPCIEALTAAEHAVLVLLARGLSNAEIASARGAGAPTIAKQVAALKRKTGSVDRLALAALAKQVSAADTHAPRTRRKG